MGAELDPSVIALAVALQKAMAPAASGTTSLQPARYVTIDIASRITGYSESAIRQKKSDGVWIEGREWILAPDNRVLIDMEGYERWAAGKRA